MKVLVKGILIYVLLFFYFSTSWATIKEITNDEVSIGASPSINNKILYFGSEGTSSIGCIRFNYTATKMQVAHDCASYSDLGAAGVDYSASIQENADVDVIGANCTLGSDEMVDLIKDLKTLTNRPISAKPNAGQPRIDINNRAYYDQPIKDFVGDIREIIQSGAKIVGGCCGTSPDTIREIRKVIDSL